MVELFDDFSLGYWSQEQTMNPKPNKMAQWFSGYDHLSLQWYDLGIPEIPIDIRFKNFQKRLKQCCDKHGFEYRLNKGE